MKRAKYLLFLTIIEIVAYICLLIFKVDLKPIWFSLLLLLIGIYSLFYAYFFRLDSEAYYGFLLIFISVVSTISFYKQFSFGLIYPAYILCFALSHFLVFVLFRQKIHLKLFAILFLICILIAGYKLNYLKLYSVLILVIAILALTVISAVFRLKKNLRRSKWKSFKHLEMVITKKKYLLT